MEPSYPDVMVDIETTGLDPSHSAIIQIAAIRFSYDTQEIGPAFVGCLEIPSNRFWDEGTRSWWVDDKWDVLEPIMKAARNPAEVWQEFAQWCHQTSPALTDNRLWAKPISFEWPFLQSYGRQFDTPLPFHYRNAVDLNSFTRGMQNAPGQKPIDYQFDIPFTGTVHNALDDVGHQIKTALMARHLINAG